MCLWSLKRSVSSVGDAIQGLLVMKYVFSILAIITAFTVLPADAQNLPPLQQDPAVQPKRESNMLTGQAMTLQEAIEQESDVDWYGWYMACRSYLRVTGGFQCAEGTSIVFNKDGAIKAQSSEPFCVNSVQFKRFRLPDNTRLEQLILPARSQTRLPASPQELKYRIDSQKQYR